MGKTGSKAGFSTGEILYYLFFGTLLFAKGIGLYDGQAVFKLILVFASACLFLKIAVERYTFSEYFRMLAVLGLTAATYLISGEKGLLLYGLMMIGMKYIDTRRVFLFGALLWAAAFFCITVSSLFHMGDTVYKVHAKLGMGHIFRWSLGYPHPNVLQVSYLILAIFIIYLLGERFKIRHAVWLFLGNCLIFLYSVSYTGFAVFICLIAGRLYLYARKKLCFLEKLLLQLIFPLCVLLSLVAPVVITGKAFHVLNQLLSTRMELAWRYLKPEYISLFGQRLSDITTEVLTMDNAYLFAFITYGIIPFSLLCLATVYMIYQYLKSDRYMEALIIITIAVGGMTEPFLYNTSFKNLSFLFMGALLFEHKQNKQGIKEWAFLPKLNKRIEIDTGKLTKVKSKALKVIRGDKLKYAGGLTGAILLCAAVNLWVSYPSGYVVYRTDCADLTKDKNYYNAENPDYAEFKIMESFQPGEEIEYFSGNIVKMEKLRNNVCSIVLGYGLGYGISIIWIVLNSRKKGRQG